jgi:PTH1 family peptidyl-tRNA hydrolase
MQLVLGLGNPGRRYAGTRHNIGFRCVEVLAERLGLAWTEPDVSYRVAVGDGPAGPLTLMQPLTYMNRSGEALAAWSRHAGWTVGPTPPLVDVADDATDAGAPPPAVVPVVVCDDIHLTLGSIRIRGGGGAGGQNGLASVIDTAGGDAVPRLRLGVGPLRGAIDPAVWAEYVLAPFGDDERERAEELARAGADALADLLTDGPERAGARHNRRIRPEPDPDPDSDGPLPQDGR